MASKGPSGENIARHGGGETGAHAGDCSDFTSKDCSKITHCEPIRGKFGGALWGAPAPAFPIVMPYPGEGRAFPLSARKHIARRNAIEKIRISQIKLQCGALDQSKRSPLRNGARRFERIAGQPRGADSMRARARGSYLRARVCYSAGKPLFCFWPQLPSLQTVQSCSSALRKNTKKPPRDAQRLI